MNVVTYAGVGQAVSRPESVGAQGIVRLVTFGAVTVGSTRRKGIRLVRLKRLDPTLIAPPYVVFRHCSAIALTL